MFLLDGKTLAQKILSEIKEKISPLSSRPPGLAFVLVGDNPASKTYVSFKKKACTKVGIHSKVLELPKNISQTDLLKVIHDLNLDPNIDGLLVQLPLPPHIRENEITFAIDPAKDVDGFHPLNLGKMLMGLEDGFFPCTPKGILCLLNENKIEVEGKHVVIVGRSNIVGKPLAALLMQKRKGCNATVTLAHSRSENLSEITRSADILISAIGKPQFIQKEMVKPKAVVVDVGMNRMEDGSLVGDVDFENVSKISGPITPVPGGVGPMTIAMLLQNTLKAFLKISCLFCLLFSCQKQKRDPCTYFNGISMTMPYSIAIGKNLSAKEQKQTAKIIEETFSQIHQTFDPFNPDSEISHLNQAEKETLIPLSLELQDALEFCSEIVTLSGGRFDPAIAPLEEIWSFPNPPTPAELQKACEVSGWNQISLQNGIFKKNHKETHLDLCAIAKGVCIDWLTKKLQALGFKDFMIEWAGDLRAVGHHPFNQDWIVHINPKLQLENHSIAPIPLRDAALSTSSHIKRIIDPMTASPLEKSETSIAAVTVIAPTATLADALSTSAMLFPDRKSAESWAQEVVELYPTVSFWILSYR